MTNPVIQKAFSEEINKMFYEKTPPMEIKDEKTFKKFKFSAFFCNFCQVFDTLASFEKSKRSTRNKLFAEDAFLGSCKEINAVFHLKKRSKCDQNC